MIRSLYDNGVIPFDINLPKETIEYFLNINNYKLGSYAQECRYGILDINREIISSINNNLPDKVWELTNLFSVTWGCVLAERGFTLTPHNDVYAVPHDGKSYTAFSRIIIWVVPDSNFDGREFVWGKFKDLEANPTTGNVFQGGKKTYDWNDPNLEYIGRIKPANGRGVVIDWTNPIYWHGVTELLSDTKITSIIGTLC